MINTYIKTFATEDTADAWMRMKNRTNREPQSLYVIVEGPADDQWSVVDVDTAIDMGVLYRGDAPLHGVQAG